ncbi:MAG: CRTAC1 family protein [Armatimonadetes bacterium]|nr:CRTAC1 family protein [Armatimonadota bacterium]
MNAAFCAAAAVILVVVACGRKGTDEIKPLDATQRMAARLERIASEADPQKNAYINSRRAENLRREIEAGIRNPVEEVMKRSFYALELLRAGKSEEAAAEFEEVDRLITGQNLPVGSQFKTDVNEFLAMSYLRIAEQENCIQRHAMDSCLMPIRGSGIHTAPRGSRMAIEHLTSLLESNPDDLSSIWLLNIAYMTLGEYPDNVPEHWLIPEHVFDSDYDIGRFYDIAPGLGLDTISLSGGCVVEDFDRDGYLDVMVSSWGLRDQIRFFRNNGDGTFTERTDEAGLNGIVSGLNLVHADYNNDGYPDVFVLRGAWLYEAGKHPNSLLRNNGDGTFTDVTEEAGLLSFHPTQTAAWGDYNNDGWIDLYIGNETPKGEGEISQMYQNFGASGEHPCELYHNNGDGTFTEVAQDLGIANIGFVKAVVWGDFNNDGWPDLYLSRQMAGNVLYRNDGPVNSGDRPGGGATDDLTRPEPAIAEWTFTDVTDTAGVGRPFAGFPTWFWDYDNDGQLDIFVSGYGTSDRDDHVADYLGRPHSGTLPKLYRNNGDGTFADVTKQSKLEKHLLAMGANFGDLDNDGFLDFYVGTGTPDYRALMPNRMFRNAEGRFFQDVTTSGGFGHVQKGHGIAFADIDNDGDQDIFEVMGGAFEGDVFQNVLFENPGHGNHWLTLQLEGVRSNRAAIGARIRVRLKTAKGERNVYMVVSTGGSFGSTTLRQEIGLGQATSIQSVEVHWPASGRTQLFEGLRMDRAYKIVEGRPGAEALELKRIDFSAAREKTMSTAAQYERRRS